MTVVSISLNAHKYIRGNINGKKYLNSIGVSRVTSNAFVTLPPKTLKTSLASSTTKWDAGRTCTCRTLKQILLTNNAKNIISGCGGMTIDRFIRPWSNYLWVVMTLLCHSHSSSTTKRMLQELDRREEVTTRNS
jgi:hypothetical protein